jgi:hypothetical protein
VLPGATRRRRFEYSTWLTTDPLSRERPTITGGLLLACTVRSRTSGRVLSTRNGADTKVLSSWRSLALDRSSVTHTR